MWKALYNEVEFTYSRNLIIFVLAVFKIQVDKNVIPNQQGANLVANRANEFMDKHGNLNFSYDGMLKTHNQFKQLYFNYLSF